MRVKKVRGVSLSESKTQDYSEEAIRSLIRQNPILAGASVTADIATTDTEVNHGLGHAVNGWILAGINADAAVWESSTANANPDRKIILKASAAVRATILFY